MRLIHKLRDPDSSLSIARRMRSKRFDFFLDLIRELPRPLRILDVGGTQGFWVSMNFMESKGIHITILNLQAPVAEYENVTMISGNACDMKEFEDDAFDIVFSNSVIEHVGELPEQEAMAREVQRVGKRYFVQTPSLFFPIEPHYMFPFFQFMPRRAKIWLLMNLKLGWGGKIGDRARAERAADSVKLLSERRFLAMFDNPDVYREKVLGLTKSFIAYGGWSGSESSDR